MTTIEDPHGTLTDAGLAGAGAALRTRIGYGATVAVNDTRAADVAVALTGLAGWASDVYLVGAREVEVPPGVVPLSGSADATGVRDVETRWHVYTSGTTGTPRAVHHTYASLARTVRPDAAARTWGLMYPPTTMAGLQVLVHTLGTGGRLLDATGLSRTTAKVAWLAERGVEALSATPTLWRQVLQSPDAKALRLRQITLGGEIADQPLLDALRRAYPDARVTHVFASTETGAAFSVSDGRAGFPRSYLVDPPAGIRLDVRDGVLYVHAPQASAAGPDGYACTGDVVEVTADRVLYLGRGTGVVNVGGVKVWPERVEAVLRRHPSVSDTVVLVRRNAFSGSVLTAQVVAADGVDPTGLAARLRAYCGEHLEAAAVPAVVSVVPALRLSASGKAGRA